MTYDLKWGVGGYLKYTYYGKNIIKCKLNVKFLDSYLHVIYK